MSNVFGLKGKAQLPSEPVDDLVNRLESLLEEAKSGKIRGFLYAAALTEGATTTGWEGEVAAHDLMSTALMMLHHRYAISLHDRPDRD